MLQWSVNAENHLPVEKVAIILLKYVFQSRDNFCSAVGPLFTTYAVSLSLASSYLSKERILHPSDKNYAYSLDNVIFRKQEIRKADKLHNI